MYLNKSESSSQVLYYVSGVTETRDACSHAATDEADAD